MHAGFKRMTAALRSRRYGTTDDALSGRVPLGGSYGCPEEHLTKQGRSELLGIGPPHVTASELSNGLNYTQSAIRSQPLRHEAVFSGRFSTASRCVYRISHLTGMPLASSVKGQI